MAWKWKAKSVAIMRRGGSTETGSVQFEIDFEKLARVMGAEAAANKSKQTVLAGGLIKATWTPDQ